MPKEEKWDYRGYKEAVDKIEQAVNAANTRTKVETAYKGITDQEKAITAELDRIRSGVWDAGDEKVLMTQRRRLRQQKQNLLNKGRALMENSVNSSVKPTIPVNEDRTVYGSETEGGNIHMESILENVKGIMESIRLSQERIEKGSLSQKDQKNLTGMLGEIMEDIDKREELHGNDNITQLKEHLGNIQDAFISHEPDKIISEQKEISMIADRLNYQAVFGNLTMEIFRNDDQIMQLQNEKADLVQQLIDLDMEVHGEITDTARRVLEAGHVNMDTGNENNGQQKADPQMEKAPGTVSHGFIGTVYLTETETNKANFYGADLESVLNTIRKQQKDPNSSMAKVKAVYIREQGATGASLKYDIASGKDITPIYLKLPFAEKEEFKKITTYLKANGAVFNPHKKAWYVTKEQDLSRFLKYMPEDQVEKLAKEHTGMQTDGPAVKENKKEILYGVEVPAVYDSGGREYKEIAQETFDRIMDRWAENPGKHNAETEKPDFSNCHFQNVTFDRKETGLIKELDFSNSVFEGCNFNHAEFESCNFQNTNMNICEINRSDFAHCDFSDSIIGQTRDNNSSFAWCDFSNTSFQQGSFTQSVFGGPNFNNARMDGTVFSDVTVSKPSMENMTLTKSGCTGAEIAEYADRTKEALQRYENSLKKNTPQSFQNTKGYSGNFSKPSRITPSPSNSIMKKLDENKIRAAELNRQNQPHETEKETAVR